MEVDKYIEELTDLHESTQWWRMTSFPQSGQRNLSEEGSCEPESKDVEEPVTRKGEGKAFQPDMGPVQRLLWGPSVPGPGAG